ncbi:MAG: aldehyde dehydrogenase family protein [Pseudomonadota bacterium]
MHHCTQFYIDGSWVDPVTPEFLPIINPATEAVIGEVALGGPTDVDHAVQAAKHAFSHYAQTSVKERLQLLDNIIEVYSDHLDDMAAAISEEMGAPMVMAKDLQATIGLGHLNAARDALASYEFEEKLGSTRVLKEPIGVCGLITPWNWPMNQTMCKVAPAIAVGCTIILKPSESAPLSAKLLAHILHEAGVPKGVFNMVSGTGIDVGNHLCAHADVDMISFTGSTQAGIQVAKTAAQTVKRVAQELGGKSANILLADVDLAEAVADGTRRCFNNTGQSCNAPTRMLVPAHLHDDAVKIALEVAEQLVVGSPDNAATNLGPLANEQQFKKVRSMIDAAISAGAELVCGGSDYPDRITKGFYVRPTIFANVNNEMEIAREEVFGPVLVLIPYQDEEDAIAIANDSVYGLAGAVWSGKLDNARRVARRIRTGTIHINGSPIDLSAPFGGYKQSGNGREWGSHGFDDFLEIKTVLGYDRAET